MSLGQRILLVDDEKDILEFLSYNLTKEGFVVKYTEDNFRMKIKFPSYVSLHKKSKKQSKKISEGCFDDYLIEQMEQLSCEA